MPLRLQAIFALLIKLIDQSQMSRDNLDSNHLSSSKLEDIPLKEIAKVLQSGGRILRSIKSSTSSRSIQPIETRTKQKSKILTKYLGQPCLKTYLRESNIKYRKFIAEDYFVNKKLRRLHKYNLPENCIFYERGFNNNYVIKLVKLIQKKSKSSEYMIQERDYACKNPQVRSVSNYIIDNGVLTVGQALVFVSLSFETFQKMFHECLVELKKKLKKVKLEELSQLQMSDKKERNQMVSQMVQQSLELANAQEMVSGSEKRVAPVQKQMQQQSQSIKKSISHQQALQIVEKINTQLKQLDSKIFQRLSNRNKTILWPSVVLQPLVGEKNQLLQLLKYKNQQLGKNDKSQALEIRLDYKILQLAFQEILGERKESLPEKQSQFEIALSSKVQDMFNYVLQNNRSEIVTHLIGTQATKLLTNGFMKWEQFSQEQIDYLIVKGPLRLLVDQLNSYIKAMNNFKCLEATAIEGKHAFFRLCKYQNQLGATQICIPIRSDQGNNNSQKKILIRLLKDQNPIDAQGQLLRWVQQSKLKVNLTIPKQSEAQKKFYYLLGNSISIEDGINYIYSDFYNQTIDFNTVLKKCYDQQNIKQTVIRQQRCIYCYYVISDPRKCYRCKFCLKFCHQDCTHNQNKPNSDTQSSFVPLSIYEAKSEDQVWTCEQCSPCNECKMQVKKNYLKCKTCSSLFHQTCGKLKGINQNGAVGSKYTCESCLKCKMCSNRLKNQDYLVEDKSIFCLSCYKNYKKNQYCYICMKQVHGKWVQCDNTYCSKWIHIMCDSYFRDKQNKAALDRAKYSCPYCRLQQRRKIFMWIVEQLKMFDQYQYFYDAEYQQITGYTEVIENPICIYKMKEKILEGAYDEKPYQLMKMDLQLLVDNALKFNMPKDQPHYRAKVLLIVGSRFLQCMQDLLECNQQFIVNQDPQQIFNTKKKKFYVDLYENYLSYLLNFRSEKSVIEVKRNNSLPFAQQFFSSKIILSHSFTYSELIMKIKKKPHSIQNLFTIPRLSPSGWWPIRNKICYYHPDSQSPIIFECQVCKQFYCCTTRCLKHDINCSICMTKGCACDSNLCGCPLIRDNAKKQLQNRIQLTLSESKLQKREYTEYYKYCLKCVSQHLKTHWCYLCKSYCYYAYQKCSQCSKYYHLSCEKKNKWEEMSIFFQNKKDFKNSFSHPKLPNLCNVCSTSQKYARLLKQSLQKEIKCKATKLKIVSKYLIVFNYIYEQHGIRLNNQEITDIIINNYNAFLNKQQYFSDFLNNFSTMIEAVGNNKIARDGFREHFMGQITRKLSAQNSHSHQRCVSFTQTKEMKQLKQSKKFFRIYSKRFNNHYFPVNFLNNYEIKYHLQHLTSKITNYFPNQYVKDSLHHNLMSEQQVITPNYKQETPFNFKNFQRIKIQVITSYVSPKSKKNIYYTTKIQKFKNYLNFWSNYYIFKSWLDFQLRKCQEKQMLGEDSHNAKKADIQKMQREYQRYLRFHADHQNLPDCIYKQESSKSLLFSKFHEQIFNPFQQGYYTARYSRLSDHKTQGFFYINNKSQMLYRHLSNFCLKIFEENKVVLKKGNTSILSQSNKSWRILKKYDNKNLEIKLQKKEMCWNLYINDSVTVVKSISDIIKTINTEISPYVRTFQDLGEFLGFNMTDSNFYQPNHFTHLLQTQPLDSFNRSQRKSQVLRVYNQYNWRRQGNFNIEKEQQGQIKSYDYNVTKKEIFYLKKRNNQPMEEQLIEPKVVPFITFDDIKKDLQDFQSVNKQKDNLTIKQPTNDVYIAPSKIDRLGLFLRNFTKKNTIVTEYIGQIISEAIADLRQEKFHFGCYMFALTKNNTRLQIIDATFVGNMGRYLNHSCDPNCKARIEMVNGQPRIFIYTIKDVQSNEQLTYDYQFKVDNNQKLVCKCKAPNCQGRLT